MRERSDVAIVGAGPAGAWAAYRLARRGVRVTIFDPSHPREKPCGGGVTPRALALASDAIDASRLPARTITHARFTGSNRRHDISTPLDRDELGRALLVVSRADFDAALLSAAQNAGADLVHARATDVSVESSGVTIQTNRGRYGAAFVIGADGANSLVRRRLSRPFHRNELSIATGYFAHGVTSAEIVIEIVAQPAGYLWSFPRPDHLAIGVCAQADAGTTPELLRRRASAWMAAIGLAGGARLEPSSWPIPSLGSESLAGLDLAGARWCLIGDAAGLVDPITREGIYFAMASGESIADAFSEDGVSRGYASRIRDEIIPELGRAASLKAGFFRPSFSHLMIDALRESAGIRAVMADLIAGRQSYAGLHWRLLKTFELGLAWRAITEVRRSRRAP